MRNVFKALLILTAALALNAGVADPAQADVSVQDTKTVYVDSNGGRAKYNQDPYGDPQQGTWTPGDALMACDDRADGWGVIAYLDKDNDDDSDRSISTAGHDSPYCTGWATGNIDEDNTVQVKACLVKGTDIESCTGWKEFDA